MPIRKPMFVVPLSLGTIATGNEASGFPASNLGETDAAGLVWKSSGATNVWARGNLGSAQSINFAALIAANAIGTSTKLRLRQATRRGWSSCTEARQWLLESKSPTHRAS